MANRANQITQSDTKKSQKKGRRAEAPQTPQPLQTPQVTQPLRTPHLSVPM
jgi:hypothetical protein